MGENKENTNAAFFQFWAGEDLERWKLLQRYTVVHEKYGRGEVSSISKVNGSLRINVQFGENQDPESIKRFTKEQFVNWLSLLDLPEKAREDKSAWQAFQGQLEEDEKKRKVQEKLARRTLEQPWRGWARERHYGSEAEGRKEFRQLKAKYECPSSDNSPTSPLFRILMQVKDDEPLADEDLEILENQRCFYALAIYYEKRYLATGNAGEGAKASSNWRKARNSQKALELSLPRNGTKKAKAAFFNSRGGALADLSKLNEAIKAVKKALELNPDSYYAYNLLGRIAYQEGDPPRGEEFFDRARELGAPGKEQDTIREDSVKHSTAETRCKTARYLFNKDPVRYSWAKRYLC